ncbi:Outer membrane protein TolC [Nonlabens sp. Hel1_33_55]|uniref:TolC family protein n=1 Tax=Nonlabens sp. Hel1_33_55 TaxID=1336802 RepID=UPI000875E16F|nr:TolC family protein [Nonlabens sp. Hel1_33_55]SCX93577.1 Outer membrane protein TolC [Nonlabens sp. Hel1_33_55]
MRFTLLIGFLLVMQVDASSLSRKRTHQQPPTQIIQDTTVLSFSEYLGYVKRHHPVAKQAELLLDEGQANLLRARGGFDPKIEVDYRRKDFKGTEYYDELSGVFKIPTWYGVEFKAGAERNQGEFLDPSLTVPEDGLYSAGVQVNLGQGLWINERMATLRKARLFEQQNAAQRDLAVNEILYEASTAYFEWWRATKEVEVYIDILDAAIIRERGVIISARAGDVAAIDTVEAGVATQNRLLGLEQARVNEIKSRLQLSNYLWLDGVPVKLQPTVIPQQDLNISIDVTLGLLGTNLSEFNIENHPKIQALNFKLDQLDVDRQLKANKLLPKIAVDYNFITADYDQFNTITQENYKAGLTFAYPIFTRKERGDLRLAKIKIADARYGLQSETLMLRNKVVSVFAELDGYNRQLDIATSLTDGTATLLNGEVRKFELGDSSLFLINTREVKFIEAQLKQLEVQKKLFEAKAALFRSLVILPENL